MSMTSLEKVLAIELAKVSNVDIPAIIEAAKACSVGVGCDRYLATATVAEGQTVVVETAIGKVEVPPVVQKPARTKKEVPEVVGSQSVEPIKPVETPSPVVQLTPEPVAEKPAPVAPVTPAATTLGIDLTGLFVGTGADKKVVKDVFLAAVEKAKNLATLVALNATCDCGFATGDYTEETAPVLKRKLNRWGAAQE